MSREPINFSEIETLEPVPSGTYAVRIEEANAQTSKKGNEMLALRFAVAEGDYVGQNIFDYVTFSSKSLYRVREFYAALGFCEADSEEEFTPPEDSELIGLELQVKVKLETSEYDGEIRNKSVVKKYYTL